MIVFFLSIRSEQNICPRICLSLTDSYRRSLSHKRGQLSQYSEGQIKWCSIIIHLDLSFDCSIANVDEKVHSGDLLTDIVNHQLLTQQL